MATRIHILLSEADKARYRRQAEAEGESLGAWLRSAAEDRIRRSAERRSLRGRAEMEEFFGECDARERRPEPDWAEHGKLIDKSRGSGAEIT